MLVSHHLTSVQISFRQDVIRDMTTKSINDVTAESMLKMKCYLVGPYYLNRIIMFPNQEKIDQYNSTERDYIYYVHIYIIVYDRLLFSHHLIFDLNVLPRVKIQEDTVVL